MGSNHHISAQGCCICSSLTTLPPPNLGCFKALWEAAAAKASESRTVLQEPGYGVMRSAAGAIPPPLFACSGSCPSKSFETKHGIWLSCFLGGNVERLFVYGMILCCPTGPERAAPHPTPRCIWQPKHLLARRLRDRTKFNVRNDAKGIQDLKTALEDPIFKFGFTGEVRDAAAPPTHHHPLTFTLHSLIMRRGRGSTTGRTTSSCHARSRWVDGDTGSPRMTSRTGTSAAPTKDSAHAHFRWREGAHIDGPRA